MNYTENYNFDIEVEEIFPDLDILRIKIFTNQELQSDFFYRREDYLTLQKHDNIKFLHPELLRKHFVSNLYKDCQSIQKMVSRKYQVMSEEFFHFYDKAFFTSDDKTPEEINKAKEPLDIDNFLEKGFDPSRLGRISQGSLYYPFNADFPRSPGYFYDEIEGPNNTDFDLDKAFGILSSNDYVWELKRVQVHPYDDFDETTEALSYKIKLPQTEFENLVTFHSGKDYLFLHLHDALGAMGGLIDELYQDLLGLKEARLPRVEGT